MKIAHQAAIKAAQRRRWRRGYAEMLSNPSRPRPGEPAFRAYYFALNEHALAWRW